MGLILVGVVSWRGSCHLSSLNENLSLDIYYLGLGYPMGLILLVGVVRSVLLEGSCHLVSP